MTSVANELAEMFLSEQGRLMRVVRRIVGNRATAEDVVQDTFVKLLRRAPAEGVANARSYLAKSASNLAIDYLRRERAHARRFVSGEPADSEVCPRPLPDAIVQGRQELAILMSAVQQLPPKCRIVFILYREHELTMKEIATHVGISEKTVEKHIMRAMVHCRGRLRAAGRQV